MEKTNYKFNIVVQELSNGAIYNVMESEGRGFIRVSYYDDDNYIFISDLTVNSEYRLHGLGTALLEYAEICIEYNKKNFIEIQADVDSWQEKWYKRKGYIELTKDNELTTLIKKNLNIY